MFDIPLSPHQTDALNRMKNGCILYGKVGSGKSRTALAYYHKTTNAKLDLYIITTAKKRDSNDWEEEATIFPFKKVKMVVDSWNNVPKYASIHGAFFIFDEQRVVGSGTWVKAFLKIAKVNQWILLSATPGDTWTDYIPVFIANGFYKNRSEFIQEHVIYRRFAKFPQIDRYIGTGKLIRQRNDILVPMNFKRDAVSHHDDILVQYDSLTYKYVTKNRWDIYNDSPIENAGQYCRTVLRLVNSDSSRELAVLQIFEKHPRIIIFYNFNYELDILKSIYFGEGVEVREWNGHKHEELPKGESWVYLVQYRAGCEGWNCITTDTMIFYSQNYSYKVMEQASGRINRMNTPYTDLYYYHLKSRSGIDLAISRAIKEKKDFNERDFYNK